MIQKLTNLHNWLYGKWTGGYVLGLFKGMFAGIMLTLIAYLVGSK